MKKLQLHKETLRSLDPVESGRVAAGVAYTGHVADICPSYGCVSAQCPNTWYCAPTGSCPTNGCPTQGTACATVGIRQCGGAPIPQ